MSDILFTFAEAVLIFAITGEVCGCRWSGIRKIVCIVVLSILDTCMILLLHDLGLPSVAVLILGYLLDVGLCFVLTGVRDHKNLRMILLGTILAYFVLHTIDYVIAFSMAFHLSDGGSVFAGLRKIRQAGPIRQTYQLIDKATEVLLFVLLHKHLRKLRHFQPPYQWLIFSLLLAAYTMITILMRMLITDYHSTIQRAIFLAWVFILLTMLMMIAVIYLTIHFQEKEAKAVLQQNMSLLMLQNYEQMSESLAIRSKQVHDFKHHLNTIRGLADNPEVLNYLDSVMVSLGKIPAVCRSGNAAIDAIINCKASEAARTDILFSWKTELSESLTVPPADLCAILANQLDNAMEACAKIPDPASRVIEMSISQQQTFTIFTVENTVVPGSVQMADLHHSAKPTDGLPHGMGLSNIRQAAERNGGSLVMRIEDNRFISMAMVTTHPG